MSSYGDDLYAKDLSAKSAVLEDVARLGAVSIVAATVPAAGVGEVGDIRFVSGNATAADNGVYYKSGAATWTQIAQMNAAGGA